MFNKQLKEEVRYQGRMIESNYTLQRDRIYDLEAQLEALKKHLGVKLDKQPSQYKVIPLV